jgi:hypothetical protein
METMDEDGGVMDERRALTLRRAAVYRTAVRFGAGPYGGIGRRVRLKIGFREECWFDSG